MNIKLSILLIIVIALSCRSNEGSELVYSHNNTNYSIEISTINTKINEAGIAQCSNYSKISTNDTAYSNYGFKLKNIIAMLNGTTPKYVAELPSDSLRDKYFDIQIKKHANAKLNYDSLVLLSISKAFELKVSPIDSLVKGYKLVVKDKEKLLQIQTECDKGMINYENGIWIATASKLRGIVKIIDTYSDSLISFDVPNQNCYSFEFVVENDLRRMNEELKAIGLMLIKTEIEQTYYKVKTVANN